MLRKIMDGVGQFEVMGVKRAFLNGPFFLANIRVEETG